MEIGIGRKTLISELIEKYPEAVGVLVQKGFHCIGCVFAENETIEEGALAHGMGEKEIDALIEEMKKSVANSRENGNLKAGNSGQKKG